WPSGPVWWVLSIMPSISEASALASAGLLASFTPPPLPRPPAWICALTTVTEVPSSRAAASASSGVFATMPRGVGTPYFRKSSLPWYSWIFIVRETPLEVGGRKPIAVHSRRGAHPRRPPRKRGCLLPPEGADRKHHRGGV